MSEKIKMSQHIAVHGHVLLDIFSLSFLHDEKQHLKKVMVISERKSRNWENEAIRILREQIETR